MSNSHWSAFPLHKNSKNLVENSDCKSLNEECISQHSCSYLVWTDTIGAMEYICIDNGQLFIIKTLPLLRGVPTRELYSMDMLIEG